MKVLAFTRYTRLGASSRLRTYQYIDLLQERNIEVTQSPLLRDNYLYRFYKSYRHNWYELITDYMKRMVILFTVNHYDVIWIEKELFPYFPAIFERLFNLFNIKYIVDYDDALFHHYESSNNPFKRAIRHKYRIIMRLSSCVVCGNDYLAYYAKISGASNITVIPTVLNLIHYPNIPSVNQPLFNNCITIGWIGTSYTVKYLQLILPVLQNLSKLYSLRLLVVGATLSYPGINIVCKEWSEQNEFDYIQQMDIGIMPLFNEPFERGKCGYKLLQYMACKKPVVASAVGVNVNIVLQGHCGFLAKCNSDWFKSIKALITTHELRKTMGANGRQLVENKYSLAVPIQQLSGIIQKLK